MKLYNEEQIQLAMRLSHSTDLTYLEIIKSLEAIELPSDEEIDKIAQSFELALTSNAFKLGAKWMRDKIQGGNK